MTTDPACVFCKIARGQIPCHSVYEDEQVLAFLDIGPLAPGHLLVIPKNHYGTMDELPAAEAQALGAVLPRLTSAVRGVTGAAGINILQNNGRVAGQEVDHVHIHLIPRRDQDGLGYRWHPTKYAEGQAEALLEKYRQAVKG